MHGSTQVTILFIRLWLTRSRLYGVFKRDVLDGCTDHRRNACSDRHTLLYVFVSLWDRNDIAGWCDSPGALATWNIFRRGFADEEDHAPDIILDHSRCAQQGLPL